MTDPTPSQRAAARLQPPSRRATTPHAAHGGIAIAWVTTLALAVAGGWASRGPAPADPLAAPPAPLPAPAKVALDLQPPLIAVASDGRVTLRVEQQPLEWVLEQIALQTGHPERVGAAAAPATPPARGAAPGRQENDERACATPTRADPGSLLFTIEHGADEARAEALLWAQAGGLKLPEPLLRSLLETSASERVLLAALEHWLGLRAGDAGAERAALELALALPSPAVQQEARQRLDDLDEIERLDAEAARQRGP